MEELFSKVLTVAYASVGIISAFGYWPTIKDVYFRKKPSANINTYTVWTVMTGISLLYGIFILNDFLFIAVSAVGFICCSAVLILSINLKYKKNAKDETFLSY